MLLYLKKFLPFKHLARAAICFGYCDCEPEWHHPQQEMLCVFRPDAQGTYTQWHSEPPVGPDNWKNVDETLPNGDTDVVFMTLEDRNDSYSLSKPWWWPPVLLTITNVRVTVNARLGNTPELADDQITLMLVIDGQGYHGETYDPTPEYRYYHSNWPVNPKTGAPWSVSDTDSLEAGFHSVRVDIAPNVWLVTQLYVEVASYVELDSCSTVDLNNDGCIDIFDLVIIAGQYGC